MDRWLDTAAVLLFAATAAGIALHSHGYVPAETQDVPATAALDSYSGRVAAALPHLERHAASGSMRDRDLACDDRPVLAEIAAIEATIEPADDPALSVPLGAGLSALRACVACTPEPRGCADAARAFSRVEELLSLPRGTHGI